MNYFLDIEQYHEMNVFTLVFSILKEDLMALKNVLYGPSTWALFHYFLQIEQVFYQHQLWISTTGTFSLFFIYVVAVMVSGRPRGSKHNPTKMLLQLHLRLAASDEPTMLIQRSRKLGSSSESETPTSWKQGFGTLKLSLRNDFDRLSKPYMDEWRS